MTTGTVRNEPDRRTDGRGDGRRLLTSSYRALHPHDVGDRYVAFLLKNETTMQSLQSQVLLDHLSILRNQMGSRYVNDFQLDNLGLNINTQDGGSTQGPDASDASAGNKKQRANASLEIDAYRLISLDPVLGNITLRYPDTLLELLEDSTVQARQVLRRRMEVALQASLDRMKRTFETATSVDTEEFTKQVRSMKQLLQALKHTADWYSPRPLHARLVHLPPHLQFCKPTLSSISSKDVGTVVQISGTVVRTGPVRMMETMRTYNCLGKGCGNQFTVHADFGTSNNALVPPVICPMANESGECSSTNFAVVPAMSEHCDYQELKIQESASALTRVGSVPRSILVKCSDDLVDKCNPGDEVVIVGSLSAEWESNNLATDVEVMVGMSMRAHSIRVINIDEEFGSKSTSVADLGLLGGSVNIQDAASAMALSSGNLREKYMREFDVFWDDPGSQKRPMATRDYIVRSVCPKLYGMHVVKLGLLLVLIGGAPLPGEESEGKRDEIDGDEEKVANSDDEAPVAFKIGGDDNDEYGGQQISNKKPNSANKPMKIRKRTQSHILLIGDPGKTDFTLLTHLVQDATSIYTQAPESHSS